VTILPITALLVGPGVPPTMTVVNVDAGAGIIIIAVPAERVVAAVVATVGITVTVAAVSAAIVAAVPAAVVAAIPAAIADSD
jgi:hypothetical protein